MSEIHLEDLPFAADTVVEADGWRASAFETEVIEFLSGDDPVARKRPGRVKYSNITLKRGYSGAPDAQAWASEAASGTVQRRFVQVDVLDPSAQPVRTFQLFDCFLSSWKLSTNEDGLVVEVLTLAVESLAVAE